MSHQFVIKGEYSADGRREFEVVEVEVNPKPDLVVIGVGGHPENPRLTVVFGMIFIAGKVDRG